MPEPLESAAIRSRPAARRPAHAAHLGLGDGTARRPKSARGLSGGGEPRPYIAAGLAPAVGLVLLAMLPWVAATSAALTEEPVEDAAAFQALGLDSPKMLEDPAGAPVDGADLERRTEEVTSLIRCPVCQGLSVADSPTDLALAMKAEARQLLAAGYSEDQILSYFERSYGEFIRLSPKPKGFNLVVWLAPILAILAGALLVAARMRAARPAAARKPATADPELESYLERVRKEAGG